MTLDEDFVYFDGDNFKSISRLTDALDDAVVNLLGHSADLQINNELFPFAAQLPLVDLNLRAGRSAALYYALSKWATEKNNVEKAAYYDTQYRTEIENLMKTLQATPTTRTKRIAVSQDYDTETEIFSQTLR